MSERAMIGIPNNGRTLKRDDPLAAEIRRRVAECKEKGIPYPILRTDNPNLLPHVWIGRIPYHAETMERLSVTNSGRMRPIDLPDHWVNDGESRLPGESKDDYERYLIYRDLGPNRNLKEASSILFPGSMTYNSRMMQLKRKSSRNRWDERVAVYDAGIEAEMRRSAQALLQEQLATEVTRRATYLDNEWEIVEKGFDVVKEMLKYPVTEKKYISPDGKTIIWQPGKWTYSAMSQLIDTLSKIGRLHTGLSTSNTASKLDATIRNGADRPQMSDEDAEMHNYAAQKAEDAYFQACEEWKARVAAPERITIAREAAD